MRRRCRGPGASGGAGRVSRARRRGVATAAFTRDISTYPTTAVRLPVPDSGVTWTPMSAGCRGAVARGLRRAACAGLVATTAGLLAVSPAAGAPLGFSKPILVDPGLAGGEPLVLADPLHGTLIYTSHEGTTHLYRNGLVTTEPA